tara:strand:+ start:853 stop:1926 length:1074 start_codon:yes stop_codon:yes gene_type:complete
VLMVISIFLISACDVYDALYLEEGMQGEAEEVPEGAIVIDVSELEAEEESEEEAEVKEEIIVEIEEEASEEVEVETVEEEEIVMEVKEEEISEDATVVIVDETEMISLVPQAQDPDNDVLIFTFTSPLDENGEWQTVYGDNGEYTLTVTVSDGALTTSKEVLIIVNKKEEPPVLNSFKPEDVTVEIKEIETVEFEVEASDLNKDELSYTWKLDGTETEYENSYTYETTYEDSGSHTVKVTITDGVFETEKIWSVTVDNLNRKPVLQEVGAIGVKEAEQVVIELDANDLDGDEVSYGIDDERFAQDGNVFTWETTYDDAGEYTVTVSASDEVEAASQKIMITVEDVNRPPVILDIVQK